MTAAPTAAIERGGYYVINVELRQTARFGYRSYMVGRRHAVACGGYPGVLRIQSAVS